MPKGLTDVRIARISRASFQNTEETSEVDFQLGLNQGVEIEAVEFGIGQAVVVPTTGFNAHQVTLSLHRETGALELAADGLLDNLELDSEIIAQAVLQILDQDEAATRGGSAASMAWLSPNSWKFRDIMGKPLLLAHNLTFRGITSAAALTINGAFASIYYRYVSLSATELAKLIISRR